MTRKSAAVLPRAPHSFSTSQKAGSTSPRIDPAQFGERLRCGREQKKRTLQEIADTTKININQLRALERGDVQRLPAGIYRRAMVRQYADAVGLNVEETSRDLASVWTEADVDLHKLEEVAHRRSDAGSSLSTIALWSSAAALLALGAVAVAATVWYRSEPPPAGDVPVATASVPTPESAAPSIVSVATTEAVRANGADVELAVEPTVLQAATSVVADDNATEGELRITSDPAGAQVTVNSIGWGVTPLTIRYMPFGKKVIRATKPGYVGTERSLDFGADRRVRSVRIQLSPEAPEP